MQGGGMGMIGGISNMALGTVGQAFKTVAGLKWDKKMTQLLGQDPSYTGDSSVNERLALARTMLNSRMPGAASMERNILGSAANAMGSINRNTTDASQALAMATGINANTNQQFSGMQDKEAENYYNNLGFLSRALKDKTEDNRMLFDDAVRRWQDKINIATAQYKARAGGGQDIINYGASMGSSLNSMFGSGGGGGASGGGMGMSDRRMKHSYSVIGKSGSGINIYQFSYLGSDDVYQGVMADEVPMAAVLGNDGFYRVDYSKIDVEFKKL